MKSVNKHLRDVKVFVDVFGRVYFDECETDLQHLTKPAEDGVRTHCRVYLDRLIDDLAGARGEVTVTVHFKEKA